MKMTETSVPKVTLIEILFINLEKYNSIILQQQREYKVSRRPSNHGKDVLCHA